MYIFYVYIYILYYILRCRWKTLLTWPCFYDGLDQLKDNAHTEDVENWEDHPVRCLRENSQTASSIYWFHILVGGIYIYMDDLWWMIHYNNHISWTLPVINGWFIYTGWWYTYPAEKWWSQLGVMNFPTEWKVIKFHGSKPPTRYCIYIYIYIAWDCTKGYDQFWSSPQVGISQKRW